MIVPLIAKANAVSTFAPPSHETAQFLGDDVLKTGIVVYLVGLVVLTAWEEWVLPRFSPLVSDLSQHDRRVSWITPLTASTPVPLPTLETLQTLDRKYVGSKDGVFQFITLTEPPQPRKGVYEHSDEWSDFYDSDVYMFKKKQ
jgi:hypothetical protein